MTPKRISGFTLIELSIVLVIIGLIIGGVMGAREMIETAKIRKQVAQFEKIAAAANVFKNKYNKLAGDALGNRDGTLNDFNGNSLDSAGGMHEQSNEPFAFLSQLANEKLIESNFICTPGTVYSIPGGNYASVINERASLLGVTYQGETWLFFGLAFPTACSPNYLAGYYGNVVTPLQASALDQKIDNGVPGTGKVFATVPAGSNIKGDVDTRATTCVVDNTATAYYTANDTVACKLMIKLQ